MTGRTAIQPALADMVRHAWRSDVPHNPLPLARTCANCRGDESLDVTYRVLVRRWEIVCGCGNTTGERRTLRAAIKAWNKGNRA